MQLSYRLASREDLRNEGDILLEISEKLINQQTSNRLVLANELRKREQHFRALRFNFDPVLARSKKFNMQMTQFDREVASIFGVKPVGYQFSAVKFLRQIAELPMFQFAQEQEDESSSSDDDGRRIRMKRSAIRAQSFEPEQDYVFTKIARIIDPETDVLVEFHQVMLEDVLFAVQQVDEHAKFVGSLFSFEDQDFSEGNSFELKIQPNDQLVSVIKRIAHVACGIEIRNQMRYRESDFHQVLFLLTRYRQMLEQVLQLWPFRYSFSFLFARALESDLFFKNDWQIRRGILATRQQHLNWYMNTVKNLLFPSFAIHFDDFGKFLSFFDSIFKTIPSAEFQQVVESTTSVSIREVINKSRKHLVVRNQLNQEINFSLLEKHVGYNAVISFKVIIKERFTGHLQKEHVEFPFTFLFKLAQRLFDAKVILIQRFPVIKQKELQTQSQLHVITRTSTAAKQPVTVQKTMFGSKLRRQGNILATNLFLQLFCSFHFDHVKQEFISVSDFVQIMQRCANRDFAHRMMRQYKIQPFLILNASQEQYFHYQQFFQPDKLHITRNMLINVFNGAAYASEQQNIQVLVQLSYELQDDDRAQLQQVLAKVFELRVDQIVSPIFFLFQMFITMQRCGAKLKYLLEAQETPTTFSQSENTRPKSIQLTLRGQNKVGEQLISISSSMMMCNLNIADL